LFFIKRPIRKAGLFNYRSGFLITSLLLSGSHSESMLAAQHENNEFPALEQSADLPSLFAVRIIPLI
jgi:hypothetical protein